MSAEPAQVWQPSRPLFRRHPGGVRLTAEQRAERVRIVREAIAATGGNRRAAAAALGISQGALDNVMVDARRMERAEAGQEPVTDFRPRAHAITPGPPTIGGWRAACMEPDEWDAWTSANRGLVSQADRAAIPCADCLAGFSADMHAAKSPDYPNGRCNGTPAGVEEDTEMDQPQPKEAPRALTMTRRVQLEVAAPPCPSCAHEPICSLRLALEGLATVETAAPPLPAGLRLSLAATVECDHFLRDRAKPAPVRVLTSQERGQANKPKREFSPEGLERLREGARKSGAIKAAKAREGVATG